MPEMVEKTALSTCFIALLGRLSEPATVPLIKRVVYWSASTPMPHTPDWVAVSTGGKDGIGPMADHRLGHLCALVWIPE